MNRIRLTKDQRLCLDSLVLARWEEYPAAKFFRGIAKDTNLDMKRVRVVVRQLARKGLAEYVKGLIDEEGSVAGSGYMSTENGRSLWHKRIWGSLPHHGPGDSL